MRDIVTNQPCGIHRTALSDTGRKVARRMLGRAKGAAIKLADDVDVGWSLSVTEGVETGLSVLLSCCGSVWSLGSAGAIERLPVLPGMERLTIWADHDPVGLNAARACGRRWAQAGVEVIVRYPQEVNTDFNDRRTA